MIHFSDARVDRALEGADVVGALRRAFADFANGEAAMQERIRTEAGGVKLSTMGGVWPAEGFVGAKVYSTLAGQFNFVIVLFSAKTGEVLATFEANALTRWRTAAVSILAAETLANPQSSTLALFGTGVQAWSHAAAFAKAFKLKSLRVVSRASGEAFAARVQSELGVEAVALPAREALQGAGLVVTATRSSSPLFDGRWVSPGAFVAAVGSSRPDTRELDDALLARSRAVVVEWKPQALREAGDLLLAAPHVRDGLRVLDLGDVITERAHPPTAPGDVIVFKSVGVGLEDVAIAGLAWQRARAEGLR